MTSFTDIAVILATVAVGGLLALRLKVPLLVVYLAAGILLGPAGLGLVSSHEGLSSLGSVGVSLFLFSIALKLDVGAFRVLGWRAFWAGLGQIGFTAIAAAVCAWGLGFQGVTLGLLVCVGVMSSTVLAVKVFAEKKELESLHGQLVLAISILQDLVAVFVLAGLARLSPDKIGAGGTRELVGLALGAGVLVAGYFLGAKAVLRLLQGTLRHSELQLLVVLALAATYALISSLFGFSRELGAFIAGLAVAASPYKESVNTRLAPVRDFLLLFFFLDLGSRIAVPAATHTFVQAAVLVMFALVVKPAVIFFLLVGLGYSLRTAFLTALGLGSISEFSFLIMATALQHGAVGQELLALVALAGLTTFFLAPFLLGHGETLYGRLAPTFKRWFRGSQSVELAQGTTSSDEYEILCFGVGRYGLHLLRHLRERGRRALGIDFDPEALQRARAVGLDVLYGDVEDEELYERLPLATAKWVVGTARRLDFNRALMQGVKSAGWDGHVALAAEHEEEVEELDRLGAHVVLRPYEDGAELAAEAITDAADLRLHLSGWPVAFREIRVRADSVCTGKTIKELSLRNRTGATIVALSRAGRVTFDPPPELQIFPNDRLLIMGRDDELEQAEAYLETRRSGDEEARTHFDVGQFEVLSESEIAGKSLAELGFRNRFGTTVVGIERAQERVVVPGPKEVIQVGDVLVVIGLRDRVRALENVPGIRRIG